MHSESYEPSVEIAYTHIHVLDSLIFWQCEQCGVYTLNYRNDDLLFRFISLTFDFSSFFLHQVWLFLISFYSVQLLNYARVSVQTFIFFCSNTTSSLHAYHFLSLSLFLTPSVFGQGFDILCQIYSLILLLSAETCSSR